MFVVGCMVVFKLSELLLFSVLLFVEVIVDVGVFVGVFNFVSGSGEIVGVVFVLYLEVDMVLIIGLMWVGVLVV